MDAGELPTDIGLFQLAERRLAWAGERHALQALNVAKANTPGYHPRDVTPFAAVLGAMSPGLAATDPGHMQPPAGTTGIVHDRPRERAPDGNAVSLEDQLMKVADTSSTQELVVNLYRKYQGLFRTALGRAG